MVSTTRIVPFQSRLLAQMLLCGSLCLGTIYLPTTTWAQPATFSKNTTTNKSESFTNEILDTLPQAQELLANNCEIDNSFVGVSLWERQSRKLYTVKLLKSNFLTNNYQETFTLTDGQQVSLRVDQMNYVNTKLIAESDQGLFIPLTVKYPIVKAGSLKEIAYYTPAHRALQSHEFDKLGERYIERILNNAARSLTKEGLRIPENVINIARKLCVIEHVDHDRYRNESSENLFKEVLTLYALNQGDCYRYSVSSAGAGGMVQMIASTYREVRRTFPQIELIADFEAGMINHRNAAKAMLLYLWQYHNYFSDQNTITTAIDNNLATIEEVMAAGYNSNPVRVPNKLRVGATWKTVLPRETQMYLTILRSYAPEITTPFVRSGVNIATATETSNASRPIKLQPSRSHSPRYTRTYTNRSINRVAKGKTRTRSVKRHH
jgi:hypothetical protein